MDIRAIKHAAKLSEWSERIRVCRSSGKPVKTWCEENGINIKSYTVTVGPAHYRTRGGEWRGCIAATPHGYMVSVVRQGIKEWRKETARKLISLKSTRFSGRPVPADPANTISY